MPKENIMYLSSYSRLVRRSALACAAIALITSSAPLAEARQPDVSTAKKAPQMIEFTVDVAEDLSGKFVPTFVRPEDTQPERGSFYVTQGRVYPVGTIQGDGADFDPNRTGHVGIWIARGTHLVAASDIPQAQNWVHTAQLFVLGRQGQEQIATEGLEGAGTVTRIVNGGTGNYAGWVGEQHQTLLGFNPSGGVNLRVTFVLQKVAP
jgi:hypothetical protein